MPNRQGVNLNMENPNLNEQNPSPELSPMNGQDPSRTKANWSESDKKRRKNAIDLWRSLSSVNGNLPEDLIADELTADGVTQQK